MIEHKIIYSFELILYITVLSFSVLINWKQVNKKFVIMFIIFNILFLFNIIIVEYQRTVIKIFFTFFYSAIGALFLTSKKIDWKFFLQSWYIIAILNIPIWLSLLGLVAERKISYMNLGTSLTFSLIIIFYRFYLRRKWYDLVILSIVFTIIALFGNRGALLASISVILLFIFYKSKHKLMFFSLGLISTIVMIVIDTKTLLIKGLENVIINLSEAGYSTLTLRKTLVVLNDGFSEGSTGRDQVFNQAIDIINNGFLPRGIGYYEEVSDYNYPHNIFLDIFVIFGYLSIPIIIIIGIAIIYYFYKETFYIRKDIVLLLLVSSFTRLLLSSSLLQEVSLWIVIGLMIFNRAKPIKKDSLQL